MVSHGCMTLLATLVALSCLRASLAMPVRPILPSFLDVRHRVAFWHGGSKSAEPRGQYPLVHMPSDMTGAGLTTRPPRFLELEHDHILVALKGERMRYDPTLAALRAHPIVIGRGTRIERQAFELVNFPGTKVSHVLNIPTDQRALQAFQAGGMRTIHVMAPVPVNQEWYSMLRIPYTAQTQQHPPLLIYELSVAKRQQHDYIRLIGAAIVQEPQNPFNFLIRWNSSPAVTSVARIQEYTRSF